MSAMMCVCLDFDVTAVHGETNGTSIYIYILYIYMVYIFFCRTMKGILKMTKKKRRMK